MHFSIDQSSRGFLCLIISLFVLAGCGGGSSGTTEAAATGDTTPPVVTAAPAGGNFGATQTVTLSASEAASIYYTTDGSTPTVASNVYSSALSIAATATLKYIGKDAAGNVSGVFSDTYTIASDVTAPVVTASPLGGLFAAAQFVSLAANETATIYYTTDGSAPTTESSVYSGPISIGTTATLKYFAKDTAGNSSAVASQTYTIDTTLPTVTASPAAGAYSGTQLVSLISNAPGTIYYTVDGSAPTTSSRQYFSPIRVPLNSSVTVKTLAKNTLGTLGPVQSHAYATTEAITDIRVVSTSVATSQANVPITFGQVFVPGDLLETDGLAGDIGTGTPVPLQVDVKAKHADGSVRHAIISGILPSLAAGETKQLLLKKTVLAAPTPAPTPADLVAAGLTAVLNTTIAGQTYSVTLADVVASATKTTWLAGPVVNEWLFAAPLKTSAGVSHPHLTARFSFRWYAGLNKARVDFIVENTKTFVAAPQNFIYDLDISVAGAQVFSQAALTHFHHARWHKSFWWGGEPAIHLKHNTGYLIASKAIPNYDQTVVPAETALAKLVTDLTPNRVGLMTIGLANNDMGTSGGRADIGPLPQWVVMYVLSMDKRAKEVMLTTADGSGTWPIHYRDETAAENLPVRLDNATNRQISVHPNFALQGPLPVPRCANTAPDLCKTLFDPTKTALISPDASHQPSLVYLPYLVTGDHFYLEELHFWAAWNPLKTSPASRSFEQGLMKWDQVRSQAWSLRTMAHAAYITPDAHPLKTYLRGILDFNLAFYNTTYAVGQPNNLGAYDGSGGGFVSESGQSSPWQDDFFTHTTGYTVALGFTDANPLFLWKVKYPIGRMTAPGYCWTDASAYVLNIRPDSGLPVYSSFAEVYAATKANDPTSVQTQQRSDNGDPSFKQPTQVPYLDPSVPCNSQAQADWRTAAIDSGGFVWVPGQMIGFGTTAKGYPANLQPALAVAATSGVAEALNAWTIFSGRAKKPNYSSEPQFAIVPSYPD